VHPNTFAKNMCNLSGKEAPDVSEGHYLASHSLKEPHSL